MGNYIKPINLSFLNLSGGTVTGNTYFLQGLSAETMSATTYYGDGSNLTGIYDYYVTGGTNTGYIVTLSRNDGVDISFNLTSFVIQLSGDTFTTGGTFIDNQLAFQTSGGIVYSIPIGHFTGVTIDHLLTASTLFGDVISGGTFISGSTNLYDIFSTTDTNDITRVQPGTNIITGGTPNLPILNLVASPSVNDFIASGNTSLQIVSATTIISGNTNLYDIFDVKGSEDITRVQPGLNTYTGGTANNPTVNISAATLSYLSATTISATTFYGDGSQLSGISTDNFYTTGASLYSSTITFNRNDTPSAYNVNLSGIAGLSNYLPLTGGTMSGNINMSPNVNLILDKNDLDNGASKIYWDADNYIEYDIQSAGQIEFKTNVGMTVNDGTGNSFDINLTSFNMSSASGGGFTFTQYDLSYNQPTIKFKNGLVNTVLIPSATASREIEFPDNSGILALVSDLNNYLPLSGGTIDGNVVVTGNVTIMGTATTIDTETLKVKDNIVTLNSNQTGTTAPLMVDSGIEVLRNSGTTASLIWSETSQRWEAGLTGTTKEVVLEPVFTVHTGNTDIHQTVAQMDAMYINVTGDTMTGQLTTTVFSATTISATTFISGSTNLYDVFELKGSEDITRVQPGLNIYTGGTENNPIVNISAATLNNLTVSGVSNLEVLSATSISAETICVNQYIDFAVNTLDPIPIAGRIYYDEGDNALSYYPLTDNMDVTVNIGQENLIKVYNNTMAQINNGDICHINGALSGIPTITLADAVFTYDDSEISGIATHNIPIGEVGFITQFGIVRNLTITGITPGASIFLSDSVAGGFEYNINNIGYSSRINKGGRVITTGTTTASMLVDISNENIQLSLTDRERNTLLGSNSSTGVFEFSGITKVLSTTFNVAPVKGWIIKNTYEYAIAPDLIYVNYSGQTGLTCTNILTADATYLLITSASTLTQQVIFPTPQQRRENIYLGKIVHPDRSTILNVNNQADFGISPISQLRDMFTPIKLINDGIICIPYTGLTFSKTAGTLWGLGINFQLNQLNPSSVYLTATTPSSFYYRTQTGGTSGAVNVIDPTKYDVSGVIISLPGGPNQSTNQRIFQYPTGMLNIQYGQTLYNTLTEAVAGLQTETFITNSNAATTGILIGILSVKKGASNLSSTTEAKFIPISKFGELLGGVAGITTATLQTAYNNSITPEIIISAELDGLSIKNGTGNADNVTNLIEGINAIGTTTSIIKADGYISASTLNSGIFQSGGTNLYDIFATTGSDTNYYTTGASLYSSTITFNRNDTLNAYNVDLSGITNLENYLSLSGGNIIGILSAQTFVSGGTPLETIIVSLSPPAIPGGSDTNVQYNNNGIFSGDTGFTYSINSQSLKIGKNDNTLIGNVAGSGITTGLRNVIIGNEAGANATDSNELVLIGYGAGNKKSQYDQDIMIGYLAGYNTTVGDTNIFIGGRAGYSNVNGANNKFIGNAAGYYNINGSQLTFVGDAAGYNNISGMDNLFIGATTGFENTVGGQNTAIGKDAFHYNLSGYSNTTVGIQAGYNSLGDNNVYVGGYCGYQNTGSDNIYIGYYAGFNQVNGSNQFFVDNQDRGSLLNDYSKSLIYGTFNSNPLNQQLVINASLSASNLNILGNSTLSSTTATTIYSEFYGNGTALVNTNLSGSTNYIPVFNSTSSITNSIIYQNLTAVGVNTIIPSATFDIHGTSVITGDSITFQVSNSAGTANFSVADNGNISATTLAAATERIITTTTGSSQLYNYLQTDSEWITDTTLLSLLISPASWNNGSYTGSTISAVEGQMYIGQYYMYMYQNSTVNRMLYADYSVIEYTGSTTAVTIGAKNIFVNSTTASTITFPLANTMIFDEISIVNINTGSTTVAVTSPSTINGQTGQTLGQWDTMNLKIYNNNYYIK